MIERQVQLEADELSGEDGKVLHGHIAGNDFDYSPVVHIGLAREVVIDHFAGSLRAMGVENGPLVPGCAALYSAWRISGDADAEGVQLVANIGDDSTDVILVREGSLLYARTLGIGVEDFIARLLPEYGQGRDAVRNVLFAELDLRPSVASDNITRNRGVQAGQEVASRLFAQITSTILLAKSAMKAPRLDAQKVFLCGPGAAIPGLRELMMNRTRKSTAIFNPLESVDTEKVNDRTRETIEAYGPALALAVGLARINSDRKSERIEFMPAGVRRRAEFLNKNLFVYLAAAVVLATLLPLFLLSRASAESAESDLKKRQQDPIGRYQNASSEIEIFQKAQDRARQRADASVRASAPGRVATMILRKLAEVRPDTVRIRGAVLEADTRNDTKDPKFVPRSRLRISFFIEEKAGSDPKTVMEQVRRLLRGDEEANVPAMPGVKSVIPGAATQNLAAAGLDVQFAVELDLEARLEKKIEG
jgi:cell division ATPase FtsA